jgi:hypothetical protein
MNKREVQNTALKLLAACKEHGLIQHQLQKRLTFMTQHCITRMGREGNSKGE